jgi:rSAM/selenodomain-associated transferase 2
VTADIDVVIPALNAARSLARTLDSLTGGHGLTLAITVCDGGSHDATASIAREAGAVVLSAEPGRGGQLARGAVAGSAPWLLFLHADTTMSAGWTLAARRLMDGPAGAPKAGYFRLRFDSADPRARRIERLAAWRSRTFGLPYGDQGLLIERAFYRQIGGFHSLPLMEDVDLARRIGRRRFVALDAEAVTSAERYERDGWLARPMRNLGCLALYFAGLSPRLIRRLYGP